MSQIRVLIIEDSAADARLLREIFSEVQGHPFAISVAQTLAEALPQVAGHDVVMLDLSLPDAHGLATLERTVSASRATPIVVLTGNDDDRTAMDALEAGAQDYLRKSEITPSLLVRSVNYAIARKRVEAVEVARAKSDEAASRAHFLAAAIAGATRSLDLREALTALARVLVPRLCDLVIIDLVEEDGSVVPFALAGEPTPDAPIAPSGGHGPLREALTLRRSVRVADFDSTHLDERHRWLAANGASSMLVTPLMAREQLIGAISYVFARSRRVHDDDDQLLAEDVAAHAALSVDNLRLYAQAQRAIAGRDELIAIVSHDLRNPINVISLVLSILEGGDESKRAQTLVRARRALDRMQHLINDLLDVARIDAGTLRVEPAQIAIASVLDDAYEMHRPLSAERGIQLVREYEAGVGHALLDRDRIAQVLGNLIGNALKFTPNGGTIWLSAERQGNQIAIGVADTGVGISPENLPHIFDRFWQKERRRDGLGLGLAIAKGLVEAHGGAIEVRSTTGAGTKFAFTLPAL